MKALAMALLGATMLSACTGPATRISSSLQRYGLDTRRSDCVGTRLQRDLSIGQLQRLSRAARAYRAQDTSPGVLTLGDLIRVADELEDPQIALMLGKAAIRCDVGPGGGAPLGSSL